MGTMERSSTLSNTEIIGIATASAAALGGLVVALGRAQDNAARSRVQRFDQLRSPDAALKQLDRGRHLAKEAASYVSTNYPDWRENVSHLVQQAGEAARPRVERVSGTAGERAGHLRESGATVLERLQEAVVPAAVSALEELRERSTSTDIAEKPKQATKRAVETSAHKADVALSATSSAAKDSLATVMWIAAALSLVYFAVLSAERREQVKNFVLETVDQIQLLVQDFQGYEEQL